MITSEESNLKSLEILVKHFKAAFEENSDDPKLRVRKVSSNDVEVDSTKRKCYDHNRRKENIIKKAMLSTYLKQLTGDKG